MPKITKDIPEYERFENKKFSNYSIFGKHCIFINCKFGSSCKFDSGCIFGLDCTFNSNCKFSFGCEFDSHCKFSFGCEFGSYCIFYTHRNFNFNHNFGSNCKFGSDCMVRSYCDDDCSTVKYPLEPDMQYIYFQ